MLASAPDSFCARKFRARSSIAAVTALHEKLSKEALHLHETLFNSDRLRGIFVGEIEKLVAAPAHR